MKKLVIGFINISLFLSCIVQAQDKLYSNAFPLGNVTLLDGPFKKAMDLNVTVLLKYSVDKLLSSYLKDAGLTPKAADYSGYVSAWAGLNGHVGGHYLSAMAMQYAATGNAQCKERMDYMVSELKKCQDKNASDADFEGYVSGIPNGKAIWRSYKAGNFDSYTAGWVPWYNIHKTYAGLRDAWLYGGNDTAKTMFIKLCDWGIKISSGLSDAQMQTMLGLNALKEQGGINEMYADAYQITNDLQYLTFAKKFSHKWLLDPMASNNDMLNNIHANAQVPKVIGFARVAEKGKDSYYQKAADFFWTTVTKNRSIAIGGNSNNERFPATSGHMVYITGREGVESCNSYNMLKLSEDLFRMKQDAKYVDFYEKTLYNHILSAQNPSHGGYVYFTPTRPRHYRVYSSPDKDMWCCVGSGMEDHTKYGQFIYTHQSDSLFVNLFIPSDLDWKAQNVKIRQETNFPNEEQTILTVTTQTARAFKMLIRHPSWVPEGTMKIIINGTTVSTDSKPSTYVEIARTWNGGEKVTVELPMHFDLEQLVNVQAWKAVKRGPIILGAKVPTTDVAGFISSGGQDCHKPMGTLLDYNAAPNLIINGSTFQTQFKPVAGKPFTFKAPGIFQNKADTNLLFEPFSGIHDSRYIMYWNTTVNGDIVPVTNRQPIPSETSFLKSFHFSNGMLNCNFKSVDPSRHIILYSLIGKKVADIPAFSSEFSFDLQSGKLTLAKGIYTLSIIAGKNSMTQTLFVL